MQTANRLSRSVSLFSRSLSSGGGTVKVSPPPATYIHPLSQLVLDRLHSAHSPFLAKHGLTSPVIKPNGTFALSTPSSSASAATAAPAAASSPSSSLHIFTSFDTLEKKHYLHVALVPRSPPVAGASGSGSASPSAKVVREGRFVLQDNLKPAWHSSKMALPDAVNKAVDDMTKAVDEIQAGE